MSNTQESPMIRALWDEIHKREPKAEFGGSVPDLSTELGHSYHRSFDDSPHDDGYSVHYYGDRSARELAGVEQYASALDVTLSTDLMIRYTGRLHHFAVSRPRVFYTAGLREFAGTLDGRVVFAWDATVNHRTYGWDDSHLWHIHISINRRFVNSRRILAIASVFGD